MSTALNMTVPALHSLSRHFAESLAPVLIGGTLIALMAWALLRVLHGQNSRTRFLVWFSALLAIAALLPARLINFASFSSSEAPATASAGAASHVIAIPEAWAIYGLLLWAVIACAGLLRVVTGLLNVRAIRKTCVPVETAELDSEMQHALADFHSIRRVEICVSDHTKVPAAFGFFRPAVVFPSWLLAELSPEEGRQILLHELAHLSRWDDWTNLLQKFLRALLFFHPAVWWIESNLSVERENACDDAVLTRTGDPRAYARCLGSLAEIAFARRGMELVQGAVGRLRQTSSRVARILGISSPGNTPVRKPAIALIGTLSVACLVGQFYLPDTVVVHNADATPAPPEVAKLETPAPPVTISYSHEAAPRAAVRPKAVAKHIAERRRPERAELAALHVEKNPVARTEQREMFVPAGQRPVQVVEAKALDPSRVAGPTSRKGAAAAAPAFITVIETQQIGTPYGAFVEFTVWHVAVRPNHNADGTAITHKSI